MRFNNIIGLLLADGESAAANRCRKRGLQQACLAVVRFNNIIRLLLADGENCAVRLDLIVYIRIGHWKNGGWRLLPWR